MPAKMKFLLIILLIHCFYARAEENPAIVVETVPAPALALVESATNYCGAGDRAKSYDDLGWAAAADKCCRTHDNECPEYIEANQTKHGLTNKDSYSKPLCECCAAFDDCLRNITTPPESAIAILVGYAYFTVLNSQCFAYVHTITGCDTYPGTDRCKTYYFDENSEKSWQWLDLPIF